MPLMKCNSKNKDKCIKENIKRGMKAGKPQAQAVAIAIALDVAKRGKKK